MENKPISQDGGQALANHHYRPDIDGLRAVAVLSVVGYHAFPFLVRGGFVGVDIFFVISGYLISGIVLGSLYKDTFRFTDFYARRIKRIFPALIVVLAACFGFGWFTLLPQEFEQLGKHIASGTVFISNLVLWKESGYFDKAADLKPLLHLWSLGIEEQFYLLWPLLLYVAWKRKLNLLFLMLSILILSFVVNVYTVQTDVVAAFYSPITRFWELTMGSMLAYVNLLRNKAFQPASRRRGWLDSLFARDARSQNVMAFTGILVIIVSVFGLSTKRAFPGWWAILPTSGALLLISAETGTWISRKILSNRLMVFVGLISYPLYLWHWPLLSFARIIGYDNPGRELRLCVVFASFVLAWLTYGLIEKPIRSGTSGSLKVFSLALLMLIVGCIGFGTFKMGGWDFRFSEPLRQYVSLTYDFGSDARIGSCWLGERSIGNGFADSCTDNGNSKPVIFVWGDSHAARLFPGLQIAALDKYRFAEYARDNCPPLLNFGYENCQSGNSFVLNKIREIKPDIVILFADWYKHRGSLERLDQTIAEVKPSASQIIIIGPAPQWEHDLPRILLNTSLRDLPFHRVPNRTQFGLKTEVHQLDDAFAQRLGARRDVTYFSAWKAFCDEAGCLTRVSEEADGLTTWDYGHLTTKGAEYLARQLPVIQVNVSSTNVPRNGTN